MVITLLKVGLLLLSYYGYWEFFRRRFRINLFFVPVFTVSCQFVILFAAGILNYLKDASVLMWAVGLVLLAVSFRKEKLEIVKPYLTGGYVYFAVMFAVIALYTYGRSFSQIDNFTHWATVVRNMFATDRFPGSLDTAVEFTSYPLGSSALIYYFCILTGRGEHIQMLAQGFLMLCAILPVFAFARKHQAVSTVLVTVVTLFLLQYNIPVTELLVDTLMPLAGMATVAFVYCQCVKGEDGDKLPVFYALPMLIWTMNIKHPALLYVIAAFALLCIGTGKEEKNRKPLLYTGAALVVVRSVWKRHCSYIDPEVSVSRHTVTLSWFSKIFGEKTEAEILNTVSSFLKYWIGRRELLWLMAWILLLAVLGWMLLGERKKDGCRFAVYAVSMYAVYALGVLGMYLFSMPASDGLAAIDRYLKSGDTAIYYLILVFALAMLSKVEKRGLCAAVGTLLLVLAASGWHFQTGRYAGEPLVTCTAEDRQRWEAPIGEYGIATRRSYLLCIRREDDPEQNYIPQYVWQYQMESSAVTQMVVTEESQLETEKLYDYVVILDKENPVIQKWLRENYPDLADSQVIQHFVPRVG